MSRTRFLTPAALALLPLLGGCSLFVATRKVDPGPFAENTTKLVADVNPTSGTQQILFIRPYLPVPSGPTLQQEWAAYQLHLRGVADYASQVAAIAESPIPESRRATELSRYLDGPLREVFRASPSLGGIDDATIDVLVRTVGAKESLLGALDAIQPAAEALLRIADARATRIREAQTTFGAEVGARIDAAFAGVMGNLQELENLQQDAMRSFALLTAARVGTRGALDELTGRDAAVREVLARTPSPSRQAFEAAEELLTLRLARIEKLRNQITPEVELYVRTRAELNSVVELSDQHVTRGRLAVIAFARSHRNLAAGLAVPPEIDVLAALKGAAVKAIP
jgi:hypothetical protein